MREYQPPEVRTAPSVEVKPTPPERQTTQDQVASLTVASNQQGEVSSLRENTVSNVMRRDAAIERVEVAAADTDDFQLG